MQYNTQWNRQPRKQENFTNKKMPVYKQRTNTKTGKKELYVDKEIDIYEKIQEYADEVSISKMLERYNLNPVKVLKKEEAQIIDITNVPENLMEMQNQIEKANQIWDRLDKKTKLKFDNDVNTFLASSENGKLAQMLHDEINTHASKFTQAQVVQKQVPTQQAQVVQPTQQTQQVLPGQMTVEQYQQMTQPQNNYNGGNV